jgi:Uma2 family endonuclease
MSQPQPKKVTYADYLTWADEPRYEIINGIPILQAALSRQHQRIITQIIGELYNYFKGKPCEVYPAPFDVRLSASDDNEEYQVVQPDISVVCDDRKLDDKGCKGAPDLIVEVLSPSTWQKDRIEKMNLYQKHEVREYLLIYPNEKILEQYILNESRSYDVPKIYTAEETFTSSLFSDFALNMPVLFS